MSTSSNLNNMLAVADVVREIGSSLSGIPGYCQCPICGHATLYTSQSGSQSGGWYQCQGSCGFTGDSVDLLAAASRESVEEFLRRRRLSNTEIYSPDNLKDHMELYRHRRCVQDGWKELSNRYNNMAFDFNVATLLQDLRLHNHAKAPYWNDGPGRIVGVGTTEGITEALPVRGSALPGRSSHAWVISPIFTAPGRITGFAGFDNNPNAHTFFVDKGEGIKDGLLFLTKPMRVTDAFATDGLKHALALHIMAQNMHAGMLPLYGYLPGTQLAWDHVRAQRIILWSPEPDIEILVAAKTIGDRAYITTSPKIPTFTDNPFIHFQGQTPAMVLETMKYNAVPWLAALKDYIMSRGSSNALDRIPDQITLTSGEIDKLRSMCQSDEERRIMGSLYAGGPIDITLTLPTGRKIVQKKDGWYRVIKKGEHALLSQAMPVIEDQIMGNDMEVTYAGYVQVGGEETTLPFTLPKNEFSGEWLAEYCGRAGHFVTVGKMTPDELYGITTGMRRPRIVKGLDSVGWDERTRSFIFPLLSIMPDGSIEDDPRHMIGGHPTDALCVNGDIPLPELTEWFANPKWLDFWKLYTAALSLIIGPAMGAEHPGTVVFSDGGAEDILTLVAKALYLPVNQAVPPQSHVWPAVVIPATKHAEAKIIKQGGSQKCLTTAVTEEHAHLAKLLGWNVITLAKVDSVGPADAYKMLGHLLPWHQAHGNDPGSGAVKAAYDLITAFVAKAGGGNKPNRVILQDINVADTTPAGQGDRLVKLVKLLMTNGMIPVTHHRGDLDPKPVGNAIVISHNDLLIPSQGLIKVLETNDICTPTLEVMNRAMEAHLGHKETYMQLGNLLGWRVADS